jgi:hypothetical protein
MFIDCERTLVCLGVSYIPQENSLALIVFSGYYFIIPILNVLVEAKKLGNGRFVAVLILIDLINFLHNV